jgi:tRNA U34 5-carboxymethylaminomethyl modifying GTPase MnmE/TrmE
MVNKIDLVQELSRAAVGSSGRRKDEPKERVNAPVNNMADNRLTCKNESALATYEQRFDVSADSGDGVPALLSALEHQAARFLVGAESALVTRARHRKALGDALAAIRRATGRPVAEREDLLAEELRVAAQALGRLTGRVDVEDVLDVIFRDFCIGK